MNGVGEAEAAVSVGVAVIVRVAVVVMVEFIVGTGCAPEDVCKAAAWFEEHRWLAFFTARDPPIPVPSIPIVTIKSIKDSQNVVFRIPQHMGGDGSST